MTRRDTTVNFLPIDFDLMDLLPDEKDALIEGASFFESIAWSPDRNEWCGTRYVDGQPWAVGGFWQVAPGVYQTFVAPSQAALKEPIKLVKMVKSYIRQIEELGGHRIQTYSLPVKRINTWMVALGFACEGTLRRYTRSGQDYTVWSRIKVDGIWRGIKV